MQIINYDLQCSLLCFIIINYMAWQIKSRLVIYYFKYHCFTLFRYDFPQLDGRALSQVLPGDHAGRMDIWRRLDDDLRLERDGDDLRTHDHLSEEVL